MTNGTNGDVTTGGGISTLFETIKGVIHPFIALAYLALVAGIVLWFTAKKKLDATPTNKNALQQKTMAKWLMLVAAIVIAINTINLTSE